MRLAPLIMNLYIPFVLMIPVPVTRLTLNIQWDPSALTIPIFLLLITVISIPHISLLQCHLHRVHHHHFPQRLTWNTNLSHSHWAVPLIPTANRWRDHRKLDQVARPNSNIITICWCSWGDLLNTKIHSTMLRSALFSSQYVESVVLLITVISRRWLHSLYPFWYTINHQGLSLILLDTDTVTRSHALNEREYSIIWSYSCSRCWWHTKTSFYVMDKCLVHSLFVLLPIPNITFLVWFAMSGVSRCSFYSSSPFECWLNSSQTLKYRTMESITWSSSAFYCSLRVDSYSDTSLHPVRWLYTDSLQFPFYIFCEFPNVFRMRCFHPITISSALGYALESHAMVCHPVRSLPIPLYQLQITNIQCIWISFTATSFTAEAWSDGVVLWYIAGSAQCMSFIRCTGSNLNTTYWVAEYVSFSMILQLMDSLCLGRFDEDFALQDTLCMVKKIKFVTCDTVIVVYGVLVLSLWRKLQVLWCFTSIESSWITFWLFGCLHCISASIWNFSDAVKAWIVCDLIQYFECIDSWCARYMEYTVYYDLSVKNHMFTEWFVAVFIFLGTYILCETFLTSLVVKKTILPFTVIVILIFNFLV